MTLGTLLRQKLNDRRGLLVPGAANALTARLIAGLGFEAVYLSGAGLTNTFYGIPDLGFMSLQDIAQHTAAIRDAVNLPLIVDADTGFGNALNVYHSVKVLERSGANAIQLEDQVMPKKCGHFNDKSIIPCAEMVSKIRAAVDARHDPDFLIIARTDSRAIDGFEAAVERANRYAEAGADVTFLEAPTSLEEIQIIPASIACPQIINIVIGGKTPAPDLSQLREWGFGMVLYANAALQGALMGSKLALQALQREGQLLESSGLVATFEERQRYVDKDRFDALNQKYGDSF
jgi:2-methylisocitrate lyase-like PEP mutase family enzyme